MRFHEFLNSFVVDFPPTTLNVIGFGPKFCGTDGKPTLWIEPGMLHPVLLNAVSCGLLQTANLANRVNVINLASLFSGTTTGAEGQPEIRKAQRNAGGKNE